MFQICSKRQNKCIPPNHCCKQLKCYAWRTHQDALHKALQLSCSPARGAPRSVRGWASIWPCYHFRTSLLSLFHGAQGSASTSQTWSNPPQLSRLPSLGLLPHTADPHYSQIPYMPTAYWLTCVTPRTDTWSIFVIRCGQAQSGGNGESPDGHGPS